MGILKVMQNNPISGVTPIDKILRTCDVKKKKPDNLSFVHGMCQK